MAHKAETTETKEEPLNPEMATPPDAASLLSGLAVAFVDVLVSTAGAAVVVAVPPSISGMALAVAEVLVSSTGITVVVAVTSGQQEISMAWLIKYTQVIQNPHVGPERKIIPSSGTVRADDAGILDHLGLDTVGRDVKVARA